MEEAGNGTSLGGDVRKNCGSVPTDRPYQVSYTDHILEVLQDIAPCVNLLWGIGGPGAGANDAQSRVQAAMSALQNANPRLSVKQTPSEDGLFREIYRNPGRYDASLWFSSATKYRLWVNQTATLFYERAGDYFHYPKIQAAIENALLVSQLGGTANPGLQISLHKLPNIDVGMPTAKETRFNNRGPDSFDYFDHSGSDMIMFGLTLSALSVMQLIVAEKRSGTLKIMRVMGLRESVGDLISPVGRIHHVHGTNRSWYICRKFRHNFSTNLSMIEGWSEVRKKLIPVPQFGSGVVIWVGGRPGNVEGIGCAPLRWRAKILVNVPADHGARLDFFQRSGSRSLTRASSPVISIFFKSRSCICRAAVVPGSLCLSHL